MNCQMQQTALDRTSSIRRFVCRSIFKHHKAAICNVGAGGLPIPFEVCAGWRTGRQDENQLVCHLGFGLHAYRLVRGPVRNLAKSTAVFSGEASTAFLESHPISFFGAEIACVGLLIGVVFTGEVTQPMFPIHKTCSRTRLLSNPPE